MQGWKPQLSHNWTFGVGKIKNFEYYGFETDTINIQNGVTLWVTPCSLDILTSELHLKKYIREHI